jgi:hypothetical protein
MIKPKHSTEPGTGQFAGGDVPPTNPAYLSTLRLRQLLNAALLIETQLAAYPVGEVTLWKHAYAQLLKTFSCFCD